MGQDKVIHPLRPQRLPSTLGHWWCQGQFQLSDQGHVTDDREVPTFLPSQAWGRG